MKYELFVIGAGGTGTYFLKEFSRFLCGNHAVKKRILSMHIYDGDVVEEKNLARQAFTMEDVGRNKAAVMAEILNETFDLSYVAHDVYVTDEKQLTGVFKGKADYYSNSEPIVPVIVSCVDNHACRLLLEKIYESIDDCILFDSGNEFTTGEVVFAYKSNKVSYGLVRSGYFPDVREGDLRNREEMSCEELNHVSPQHIFTNMVAGNLLCSGLANLFDGKITPGFAYFNALSYSCDFVPYKGAPIPDKKEPEKKTAKKRKASK